jgi:hypothetical protein
MVDNIAEPHRLTKNYQKNSIEKKIVYKQF